MNVTKLISALTLTATALTLTACQTLESRDIGLLSGKVRAESGVDGPFIVAVIDRSSGKITHRAYLEDTGYYKLLLDGGDYKFLAFADLDRDGHLGANEPTSVRMTLSTTVRAGDVIDLPPLQVRNRTTTVAQHRPEAR